MATQNTKRLQARLEDQDKAQSLVLNDLILNDSSCTIVASFLESHQLFTSIELKGNNLSPKGFAIICQALQGAQNLKELHLEWNQIGQDSLEGLDALLKLLDYNGTIIFIDLKNNNINSDGAYVLSRILEVNRNLLSLDLKWNEIGVKGAEMLLEGLERNTLLKNLDISCNKVPEEMIAEVNRILSRNRSGNYASMNIGRPPRQASKDNQNTSQLNNSQQQASLNDQQSNNGSLRLPPSYPVQQVQKKDGSMSQVERMLKNEKKRVVDMKERIERDLLEEKRIRDEFEVNLLKIRDSVLQKEGIISGLQLDFNNLINENSLYKRDLENIKMDLSILQEKYSAAIEDLQLHIGGNNKSVAVMEREQLDYIQNLTFDHQKNMKELIREWSLRYGSLDEKYISLKTINADIKDRVNLLQEQMLRIRMEADDQQRNLKIRIVDESQRAFEQQVKQFENAIRVATEQRTEILRKNEEIVKDINYKQDKYQASILNVEKDISDEKILLNTVHNKLSIKNMKIESSKTKHVAKDDDIRRKEEELMEAQRTLQRFKEDSREKVDYIVFAHQGEKRLFKDSQDILHRRVVELERSIRSQEQLNSKIKTEYEKLCHVLQSNIQRTIADTLTFTQDSVLRSNFIPQQPPPSVLAYPLPPQQVFVQQVGQQLPPPGMQEISAYHQGGQFQGSQVINQQYQQGSSQNQGIQYKSQKPPSQK